MEKIQQQNEKNVTAAYMLKIAAAYLCTLAVLFALLFAAYALPGEPVRKSIAASVPTLQQEELYPEYFGFKLFQMDNYTDTIMLFEAASADEAAPLTAMMTNTAYNVDNFETLPDDLAAYLTARAAGQPVPASLAPFSYARYWHGYMLWLRPLLLIFSYAQIRVIQYIVLFALLALILVRLYRRCGARVAVWFGVSQALVSVVFVPHQVQYFTCFVVAYAGCAWVLDEKHGPRGAQSARTLTIGLLVLGVCTAFCDLLVTPIITLALPMAVWLVLIPQRLRSGVRQCAVVISGSVCWGVGYGLCWASKWVMASLVTGRDVIGDAVHQAGVRTTADTWHGIELTWGNIFRFVGDTLAGRGLLWPCVLLAVLCVAGFCLCLRGKAALVHALPLGLTALMAPVWLTLLRTHSIQHGWFTWRALAPTLFAGMAFVYYSCSLKAGWNRLRAKQKNNAG